MVSTVSIAHAQTHRDDTVRHKVPLTQCLSICPAVSSLELGPSNPPPQASVPIPPPPKPRGGGLHTRLRVRGWGGGGGKSQGIRVIL
jgi:hypothetical protein